MAKIAAILVRGLIGTRPDTRKALDTLRLRKKHACVILEDNPVNMGALHVAKDFITYGPVSEKTIEELRKARTPVHDDVLVVFSLAPPKGGFERKGIKTSFKQGGVLSSRPEMDTLIKKMM